ncbi:MAG: aspartate carbamoyltransferase catalytic subunit [Paracoccaceae bacterium]
MSARPAPPPPGWEDLLDAGETILWQGRPEPGITLRPVRPAQIAMGVFMTAFAVFWTSMAFSMTRDGHAPWFFRNLFPLFGLIFVGAGLHMAGGYALTRAVARRFTWYTLTNRRAFIATELPWQGKRLKSYVIAADTALEYDGADPGTLWFASETRRGNRRSYTVPIGFKRIAGARKVHRLISDIQKGQTA